jgi:hypothetical protein
MRRSPLVLLALPVAWIACFSSSSSGSGGGANFDASGDTTFPMEGSAGDAPEDITTMDAPVEAAPDVTSGVDANDASESDAGAVSILVFGASGPEQGVSIVFGDATGAVVGASATTAVNGLVNQALPAGATMITALLGTAANPSPYTVMGVQTGDFIVVPDFASLLPYESGFLDVTALPAPPPANATGYAVSSGACESSGAMAPFTVSFYGTSCFGLGAFGGIYHAVVPVLAEAYDVNGALLGFTFQKSNALAGFDAGAGTLPVSLAAATWSTSTTTQELAVANAQDGGPSPSFYSSEVANGVVHQLSQQTVVDDAGAQHTEVTTHVGYADTLQSEADISSAQWAISSAVGTAPPTSSGTVTIDATSLATLPQITAVSVDPTVPAQPKLTWTLSQGSLAVATGLVSYTQWQATSDAGTSINGNWTVVAPSSATSIQAPALPASSGAYQPPAGAQLQGTVQGLVGSVISSYAKLRTVGATIASPATTGCVASPVLPALGSGTLSVTIYMTAGCG